MKYIILTILFTLFNFNDENYHPVHFSVINMEYNSQEEVFDISVKLFTDDFEKIVNKNYNVVLNLGKSDQLNKSNDYIDKYIKKNFVILFDKKNAGKNLELKKVIIKNNENATWVYYALESKKPHKVTVRNTLLLDLYNDQKNLFIFTFNNFQEAKKFKKSDTDLQFVIK